MASTVEITVTTFNIRRASLWDGRNDWRYRKEAAADAIIASGADFVGTQEATLPMLQQLADLVPQYAWIGEGRRGGTKGEHNAIMYRADRWHPERSGTFWLSETSERAGSRGWGALYPRICTWAVFQSIGDASIRIAIQNAHLDHISARARMNGAALIAKRMLDVRGQDAIPAVLLGDLNAAPHSDAIVQLRTEFGLQSVYEACTDRSAELAGATFHRFRGDYNGEASKVSGISKGGPIDYIFVTDNLTVDTVVIDRTRYRGKFPSDHYPVTARLRWSPRTEQLPQERTL